MNRSASPSPAAERAHPAGRFLQLDEARLHYEDEGEGPAVLLVHGWTLDLEMWEPQARALQDSFRVVRLDRRGYGLSGGVPAAERDASDLAALCSHLGLKNVALLGMSQGARCVLEFAATAALPVTAVILDGPPALEGSDADNDVPLAHYQALLRTEGIEAVRREWARHPLTQLHNKDEHGRALLARMLQRYTGADLTGPGASVTPAEMRLRLKSVTAPLLVVNGEFDLPTRLRAADLLCSLAPAAQRALIARSGHLPNLDNPDLYNSVCRSFLMRHATSCNASGSGHG